MVIVGVIGILAVIAVPNFLEMRQKAKVAEVKTNLGAIRVTQVAFFTEYNRYVGNQDYTPDRSSNPPGRFAWNPATRFSLLGYSPEGTVYFSYAISPGIAPDNPDFPSSGFELLARSDLDDDGLWSVWVLSSNNPEITHLDENY